MDGVMRIGGVVFLALLLVFSRGASGAEQPPSSAEGTPGAETATAPATEAAADGLSVDALLEMDLEDLARVRVSGGSSRARETELTAPSSAIDVSDSTLDSSTTTGQLATRLPGVSVRRLSGINQDPRVRGYHSGQLTPAPMA
jgi:hypothetical protein